jgi:tRNA C32,U32 (ribose-2'-O)-methylase TrmJ
VSGKRPDDWTLERLEEMAVMAAKMSKNIAEVVRSMKDMGVDTLTLQARKKSSALHELVTWAEFDLRKALSRQSTMRAKATYVAESAKRGRRKRAE